LAARCRCFPDPNRAEAALRSSPCRIACRRGPGARRPARRRRQPDHLSRIQSSPQRPHRCRHLPGRSYTLTLQDTSLDCKSSAALFARFLEDYDGVLPKPWVVSNEGPGKSSFLRAFSGGTTPGFAVELTAKERRRRRHQPDPRQTLPGTFTVNSTTVVGPLRFTKGAFLIYQPAGSGITCNRASVLFTRSSAPAVPCPPRGRCSTKTATFYKPSNPKRSAFRIER